MTESTTTTEPMTTETAAAESTTVAPAATTAAAKTGKNQKPDAAKKRASKATTKAANATKGDVENHTFQTEVQQLLHLMIHSLYSNKEIFLRELISNASDACDRLRYQSLTDSSLMEDDEELGIWLETDEKKKTVTIRDNGIGMTHDEVIRDIGTIARSGTKAFLEKMSDDQAGDARFIGQFGVGFYSSFLVGKTVTLLTRKAGTDASEGVRWVSDGNGEYTTERVNKPGRGTEITIALTRKEKEYSETFRLRNVVSRYSEHISLPIWMLKDPERDEEGKIKEDQPIEWEIINKGSALWARPRKEVTEEEHQTFYTALTYDPEPPALTLHHRVEGKLEYISLFYIPAKAPYNLWDREQRHGVKLYVRRIFIADDAKTLMPHYLRFVRGLVDSADLPLNVSREFLQQNKDIDRIRTASVKRILTEFKKLANKDEDKYNALWKEYGRVLKEGVIEDYTNREAIAALARFCSTHNDDSEPKVSLDDYISRMPEKQKAIYYITAESFHAASTSPHLEVMRQHGIEVLLMFDSVDEWFTSHLKEYEDKPLKSIAKGDLDIGELRGDKAEDEKDEAEKTDAEKTIESLVEKFKTVLEDCAKDVRISHRLVDSPSCLVADEHDMSSNMARILQTVGQGAPDIKPVLEINPEHELVKGIDPDGEQVEDWAKLLFDQAALAEGAALKSPNEFVKRINRLLSASGPMTEDRGQKSTVSKKKAAGKQKAADDGQKTADEAQKAEDNKPKAEDNKEKTEDDVQKIADEKQKAEDDKPKAGDGEGSKKKTVAKKKAAGSKKKTAGNKQKDADAEQKAEDDKQKAADK